MLAQDPDSQLVMTRAGDDVAFGLENAGAARGRDLAAGRRGAGRGRLPVRPGPADPGALRRGEAAAGAGRRAGPAARGCCCSTSPPPSSTRAGAALVRDAVARATADRGDHAARRRPRRRALAAAGGPGGRAGRRAGWSSTAADWRPAPRAAGLRPAGRRRTAGPAHRRRRPASPTAASRRPALPPTDAALRGGRALAVTGPNGSGKSTLALLLAGLRAPTTGRVEAADELAAGRARGATASRTAGGPASWSPASARCSSTPSSSSSPAGCATSWRWARCAPGEHAAAARATADELLERLGLTAFADANPYTLSGGQQRRLSVATALATSPRVLVLDEPTFGQDAATWRELVILLAEQRARGCAVVVVTHDADLVDASSPTTGCVAVTSARARPGARRPARPGSTRSPSSTAIAVVTLVLLTSLDVVTPAVVVAAELCLLRPPG